MILPKHIREIYAQSTCLYTKADIEAALDKMAHEISQSMSESNPVLLCVVLGGIVPLGNLLLRLDFPLAVDYVHATRYRGATQGSDLKWKKAPSCDLKGRNVLIVDDILDGGATLKAIVNYCHEQGAQSVSTAVLLDKTETRDPEGYQKADFTALEVGNYFVFGYGMDYQEYLRNAPGIYAIEESKLNELVEN